MREKYVKGKRALSFVLVWCMVISLLTNTGITLALADETAGKTVSGKQNTADDAMEISQESSSKGTDAENPEDEEAESKEITETTYDQLGLELNEKAGMDKDEPIITNGANGTPVYAAREIYAAANGSKNNRYTVRNGFNKLLDEEIDADNTTVGDEDDSTGKMYGAYQYWDINDTGKLDDNEGNTHQSFLGENDYNGTYGVNSMIKESNEFSGIYATSTEFNRGEGKDNYIAEIRAYGDKDTTNNKKGKLGLQIFKLNDPDGRRSQEQWIEAGTNNGLTTDKEYFYFGRNYVQELDAMFEVEAADVDGDGIDELFAYWGEYRDFEEKRYAIVKAYKYSGSQYTLMKSIEIDGGSVSSYKTDVTFGNRPVITLAGGDLNGDGKDEICIALSATNKVTTVSDKSRAKVLAWDSGSLEDIPELKDISMTKIVASGKWGLMGTNCTFGTFALPGMDQTGNVLIIAGFQTDKDAPSESFGKAGYRCAYYDGNTEKYVVTDYVERDLGTRGKQIADAYNGNYEKPIRAPFPLACANLEGAQTENCEDEICFGGDIYLSAFSQNAGDYLGEYKGSLSLCKDMENKNDRTKDKDQLWISDVQVGCVDTNPNTYNWRESFVYTTGARRDVSIDDKDDHYYWMNTGIFYLNPKGDHLTFEEGVIVQSNVKNNTYGTFLSFCLPDIQDDSVQMKFKEKYLSFTDPQLYAVLQAAPYFEDLQNIYNYIGNGGTTFEMTESSGSGVGATINASAGLYTSADLSILAAGEYEAEAGIEYSYDYMSSSEMEYAIEYNNQGGSTDKVVLYSIPIVYYVYDCYYDTFDKKGNKTGRAKKEVIFSVPQTPSTSIVDVEKYDEIARETEGLRVVGGDLIKSTPGNPETYENGLGGHKIYSCLNGGENQYSTANSLGESSDIKQVISTVDTKEHQHQVRAYVNAKVGAGVGFGGNDVKSGFTTSVGAGVCFVKNSSKGLVFSGTVDNLPSKAKDYSFNWNLRVHSTVADEDDAKKSGENGVWIIGYDIKDTIQPPRMPQGLAVKEITSDTVTLEWEKTSEASFYELFTVDVRGEYNLIAMVPGNTTEYVVKGLEPNTKYDFAIRAVSEKRGQSMKSPIVTATTLGGGQFEIVKAPKDQSTYVGGTASFQTLAKYMDSKGESRAVLYLWQLSKDNGKKWENLTADEFASGVNSNTLKISGVTEEMDGWKYRAKVYYLNRSLFSETATLSVDKAVSTSEILIDDVVYNDAIVNSEGVIRSSREEKEYQPQSVSIEKEIGSEEKRLTLYTNPDYSEFYWGDGYDYYAQEGALTMTEYEIGETNRTLIDKDVVFGSEMIGEKIEVSEKDFKVTMITEEGSIEEYNLAGPLTSVSENCVIDGTTYQVTGKAQISENTVYEVQEEENDSVEYYFKSGEDYTKCDLSSSSYVGENAKSSLSPANQAVETTVTIYEEEEKEGDVITLRAKAKGNEADLHDGEMKFLITGAASQTIKATYNKAQQCYVAQWVPTAEGTFNITANYGGDNKYYASTSSKVTVHAVMENHSKLAITVPGSMTYGKRAKLSVMQMRGSDENTTQNVTRTAEYTVEKYNDTTKDYETVSENSCVVKDGMFTPKTVGTFRITASKDNSADSAIIIVNKGRMTMKCEAQNSAVNAPRNPLSAIFTGYTDFDEDLIAGLSEGTDYQLESAALAEKMPGDYPIKAKLMNTQAVNDLKKLYNIVFEDGVYTLTSTAHKVDLKTNDKGSAEMTYELNGFTFVAHNGDYLPEGSRIVVQAVPNPGCRISRWKVDDTYITESGEYVTDTTYTLDSLEKDTVVSVEFEDLTSAFSYSAYQEENTQAKGTVKAYYNSEGGSDFTSGSKIAYKQKVVVSAQPKEGYVVDCWTVKTGDGQATVLKAEDGSSTFTGQSYTFTNISEDTEVLVRFTEKRNIPLTVKVLDPDGVVMKKKVSVSVADTKLEKDDNHMFIYEAVNGDNLTISVEIPDNLMIDSWEVGDNQQSGSLSDEKRKMTIYNLQNATDFVVRTCAYNSYSVSFDAKMEDGTDASEEIGTVSAVKVTTQEDVTSGSEYLQGSEIVVKAVPEKDYVVIGWKVNDNAVQAENEGGGVQSYRIDSLSEDVMIVALFKHITELMTFWDVPTEKEGYTIKDVVRTPDEYGAGMGENGVDQIVDGGSVSFTLIPDKKDGKDGVLESLTIFGTNCLPKNKKYPVVASNKSEITVVENEDGSVRVTIANVKADIEVDASVHYHEYVAGAKVEPSCTSKGYVPYTCVCGDSYHADEKPLAQHTKGAAVIEKKVAPTYKKDGSQEHVVYCTVCKKELSRTKETLARKVDDSLLLVKATASKGKMKLTWNKNKSADGYIIKYAKCGTENWKSETIKKGSVTKKTFKNLNKAEEYKFVVKAYQIVNGKKKTICSSKQIHVVASSDGYTNVKKVKVSQKSLKLKVGESKKIKAELVKVDKNKKLLSDGHGGEIRYISTDASVATVGKNGKIKAVGNGSCQVYVMALNGYYAKVKVTVSGNAKKNKTKKVSTMSEAPEEIRKPIAEVDEDKAVSETEPEIIPQEETSEEAPAAEEIPEEEVLEEVPTEEIVAMQMNFGVPAFAEEAEDVVVSANDVNLEDVLFTSTNEIDKASLLTAESEAIAEATEKVWKLTMLEEENEISLTEEEEVTKSEDGVITVPYTYVDCAQQEERKVNQVSVMITDKAYGDEDAKILYYGALDNVINEDAKECVVTKEETDETIIGEMVSGTGTFILPEELSEKKFGEDYYIYLLAECVTIDDEETTDVNEGYYLDFASCPVQIMQIVKGKIAEISVSGNDL